MGEGGGGRRGGGLVAKAGSSCRAARASEVPSSPAGQSPEREAESGACRQGALKSSSPARVQSEKLCGPRAREGEREGESASASKVPPALPGSLRPKLKCQPFVPPAPAAPALSPSSPSFLQASPCARAKNSLAHCEALALQCSALGRRLSPQRSPVHPWAARGCKSCIP